jgi:tRNA nucleotidyltransferase (CCA-adding enzyme)
MLLQLSDIEKKLFTTLSDVAKENGTVVRVAGGYIRDKLLCVDSCDIDIAVSNMTGEEFAKHVKRHMENKKHKTGNISVVKTNPDQSKHLATAMLNVYGYNIDFVNLRSETYSDSRIPQTEFGTPLQDAQRRDLTINAMFYNITDPNNMFVEDLVGGKNDLVSSIARTPIDSRQTFLDDPLRILRIIRFCARFSLTPSEDIVKAANLKEVQEAFIAKISSERIWAEMVGVAKEDGSWKRGFLTGNDPLRAMKLVNAFGFRDLLFRPRKPDEFLRPWDTDQNNIYHDLNIWDHTMLSFEYMTSVLYLNEDPKTAAIRHLALLLHDIGKCDSRYTQLKADNTNSFHKHEERSAELAALILDELSSPADIRDRVVRLIKEHCRFMNVEPDSRDSVLRRIIRDLDSDWENILDMSLCDAYGKKKKLNDPTLREKFEIARKRMTALVQNQSGQTKIKRPINGHDLIKMGITPGPKIGEFFDSLDEALLEKPDMSREDALAMAQEWMVSNG